MSAPEPTTAAAQIQNHPSLTNELGRVSWRTRPCPLEIVPYSPSWPSHYTQLANRILTALGPFALSVAHVGSTSIPNMPAKAVIDIDVVVADPTDEASYVSALVGQGWEGTGTGKGSGATEGDRGAGLQFMFREPEWYDHRFFIYDEQEPVANVHVFGPGCPETRRHQIFREWLLAVSCYHLLFFPFFFLNSVVAGLRVKSRVRDLRFMVFVAALVRLIALFCTADHTFMVLSNSIPTITKSMQR